MTEMSGVQNVLHTLLVGCDAALCVTEGQYILSRIDLYERLRGDTCVHFL